MIALLGYKAVVADEKGQAKILSAKTIVRKMREQGLIAANGIKTSGSTGILARALCLCRRSLNLKDETGHSDHYPT